MDNVVNGPGEAPSTMEAMEARKLQLAESSVTSLLRV